MRPPTTKDRPTQKRGAEGQLRPLGDVRCLTFFLRPIATQQSGWYRLIGFLIGLLFGIFVLGSLTRFLFGLLGGLENEQLDKRTRLVPNQGIWHTALTGVIVGLLGLLVFMAPSLMVGWLTGSLVDKLAFGLQLGLGTGLHFGLMRGLDALLQHFILRFWLWRAKCIPLEDFTDSLQNLYKSVSLCYIYYRIVRRISIVFTSVS
jgi:hypothetical protein